MAISDYLNKLVTLRSNLETTLSEKGISVESGESLDTLISKVQNVTAEAEPIEKVLYSFGVLSDIHLLDSAYNSNYTGEKRCLNALSCYQRALTFYENNRADFICIPGDIVAKNNSSNGTTEQDISQWVSEVSLFKQYSDTYFTKPVYATTGNHDAQIAAGNSQGLAAVVTTYGDGTKTAEEVWTEIVERNPRYVIEQGDDVFIFLVEYYWNYVNFCRDEDIAWLREQLELYKEKRVFLFAHLLLRDTYDGNLSAGTGMEITTPPAGRSRDMKNIVLAYPNVVWFNGHSHYDLSYEGQEGFNNPNTYQSGDSATMIHVPSCAYLRVLTASGGHDNADGSQGLWVDVYDKKIVIKGIDFTLGNGGAFIPKVKYVINTKY